MNSMDSLQAGHKEESALGMLELQNGQMGGKKRLEREPAKKVSPSLSNLFSPFSPR
jgi:hypothetical protein